MKLFLPGIIKSSKGFLSAVFFLLVLTLVCPFTNSLTFALDTNEILLDELGDGPEEPGKVNDSNEDLLDELDTDISKEQVGFLEEKDSGKENNFQLIKNLSASFRTRYYYYFRAGEESDNEVDKTQHYLEGQLEFKTFYDQENLRFNISGWAEVGTQSQLYIGVSDDFQDNDSRRNYLEINELFLNRFSNAFNLSLGKKKFVDGLSTIYSPANRYGAMDLNDPLDPKVFGIWLAQLDVPIKNVLTTMAVFPIYQDGKSPLETSRWSDRSSWNNSSGTGNNIEEKTPGFAWENLNYFFRTKATVRGWDLFLSLFHGFNRHSVYRAEIDGFSIKYKSEIVDVFNLATGFSTTIDKWEFHGEALFNYTYGGKDDNYLDYVVGFLYTMDEIVQEIGLEKIDFLMEYGGEIIFKHQDADSYVQSSKMKRPIKNDLITGIVFHINKDLKFRIINEIDFNENGIFFRGGMGYKFNTTWKLDMDVEYFGGPKESYLGSKKDNDRFLVAVKYFF